ncbi:MAG: hypothetical protein ACRCZB_04975 [Bacteroidales bacterium]
MTAIGKKIKHIETTGYTSYILFEKETKGFDFVKSVPFNKQECWVPFGTPAPKLDYDRHLYVNKEAGVVLFNTPYVRKRIVDKEMVDMIFEKFKSDRAWVLLYLDYFDKKSYLFLLLYGVSETEPDWN